MEECCKYMTGAWRGNVAIDCDGKLIVLTAPLTETIDHAGYFVQMALASLPTYMEGVIDKRYPNWRDLERDKDGSARYMPAGVRLVEASVLREFSPDDVVCCYPDDLPKFIGPRTRVVAVSTHNPLGVTFAAGVYASILGTSREPINSHYAKQLFQALKDSPYRPGFKVIVGGSGGWQISQTDSFEELSVDCVVEGRSESQEVLDLFHKAIARRRFAALCGSQPSHRPRGPVDAAEAHHLRRGRNDHRVRAALPVLPAGSESADRLFERQHHGGGARQRAATATTRSRSQPRTCSSGDRCTRTRRSISPTARRFSICSAGCSALPGWSITC